MEEINQKPTITQGIAQFIFGLAGFIVTWYTIPIVIDILPINDFAIALFWIALIAIWIGLIIIRPLTTIRRALQ